MANLLFKCPDCVNITGEKVVACPNHINTESELLEHYVGETQTCRHCGGDMEVYDAEL